MQQAIKVIQQKLAAVIQELEGGDGGGHARDPIGGVSGFGGLDDARGGASPGDAGYGEGFSTPFVGGGGQSAWGGGATPYGATPYGQNGWVG